MTTMSITTHQHVMSNIDDVRAKIMELESAQVFDPFAWAGVMAALEGRPAARADAIRRMETARANAVIVSAETVEA